MKDIIAKSPDILPHTINVNGAPLTDNASIAEAFNEFFITNATKITKDIPRQNFSEEARESNVNVNDSSHFSPSATSNAWFCYKGNWPSEQG